MCQVDNYHSIELSRLLEERGIKGGGPQRRWRFVTRNGLTGDDIYYGGGERRKRRDGDRDGYGGIMIQWDCGTGLIEGLMLPRSLSTAELRMR